MRIFSSLFAILFCGSMALGQQEQSAAYIEVVGQASMTVSPDHALITIGVIEEASSANEAYERMNQASRGILEYLRKRGDVAELQTDYLNLQPNRNYNDRQNSSFRAQQSISFTLEDLQNYDELMLGLFERGVSNIQQVSFRSSQEEAIRESLLAQAVLKGREKAMRMTAELNQQVGEAIYISDHLSRSNGPQPMYEASLKSSGGPSVQPGQLELSVIALLHFRLK